jgi:hypothetical protein
MRLFRRRQKDHPAPRRKRIETVGGYRSEGSIEELIGTPGPWWPPPGVKRDPDKPVVIGIVSPDVIRDVTWPPPGWNPVTGRLERDEA